MVADHFKNVQNTDTETRMLESQTDIEPHT